MSNIIEVSGVSKSYGGVKANVDISMTVKEGSITGIIGLTGVVRPPCLTPSLVIILLMKAQLSSMARKSQLCVLVILLVSACSEHSSRPEFTAK